MGPIGILLLGLGVLTAIFVVYWVLRLTVRRVPQTHETGTEIGAPNPIQLGIGFVTDFLDTLAIGSFATTTALFRFLKQVPDRLIPGTLNIGHALPTVLQAYIYVKIVEIGPTTLVSMIAAAVAGAWLGAGVVAGLPRRQIQIGMGVTLLIAAVVIFIRLVRTDLKHEEGVLDLSGMTLALGIVGNFVLGALMTIGIGLYAPCMILVALLGMKWQAAFPIMMGSCAFLMPISGFRFIEKQSYSPKAALGLALGGLPAVALAAWLFTWLDPTKVNWLVIIVVVYTAVTMLRSAFFDKPSQMPPAKGQA